MRYYNENPQVTYWRKKYEEQKAVNKETEKELAETKVVLEEYMDDIEYFHNLPWYEKLFYKFWN